MVYRRRRGTRMRAGRKTRRYGRSNQLAFKVNQMYRNYKQQEVKTLDQTLVNNTVDEAGVIYPIHEIAEGLDYDDRIGRQISNKSIQLKGTWVANGSATVTFVRLILFMDYGGSTATPQVSHILPTPSYHEMRSFNSIYLKRYKILWDKTYCLDADGKGRTAVINFYKKLHNVVKFGSTATTGYAQGSLNVLAIGNNATNLPSLLLDARLRYTDL